LTIYYILELDFFNIRNSIFFAIFYVLGSLATPTRKYNVWNSRAWVILPGDDFRFNFNNSTCTVNLYHQNWCQLTLINIL